MIGTTRAPMGRN